MFLAHVVFWSPVKLQIKSEYEYEYSCMKPGAIHVGGRRSGACQCQWQGAGARARARAHAQIGVTSSGFGVVGVGGRGLGLVLVGSDCRLHIGASRCLCV